MKLLILLLITVLLQGCAVKGCMYKKETPKEPIVCLKLWGWGAKRWEVPTPNGSFVIEKEEPIKVPNLIPFRN